MKKKIKKTPVLVTFQVTVNIGRRDAQPIQEFIENDLPNLCSSLKDRLEVSMKDAWAYNAIVLTASAKQI